MPAVKPQYASYAAYAAAVRREIVRRGQTPVRAVYDAAGNCTTCGEAGRCPGWHPAAAAATATRERHAMATTDRPRGLIMGAAADIPRQPWTPADYAAELAAATTAHNAAHAAQDIVWSDLCAARRRGDVPAMVRLEYEYWHYAAQHTESTGLRLAHAQRGAELHPADTAATFACQ